MPSPRLVIRAGARATRRLRDEGFSADLFDTLVGASGGPKWLVLRHLDRELIRRVIAPRETLLDTLGASIGSFRHACFAQHDPEAALERFAESYVEQRYDGQPTAEAVSLESDRILARLLGEEGATEIASHERIRSHVVAARLDRDPGADRGWGLRLALGRAALRNLRGRRHLGRSFERVLFASGTPNIVYDDFPTRHAPLTAANLPAALLASGSIPLVMKGVRGLPGLSGVLYDGGVLDYHFDFEFRRRPGLVLFPHFFDRIVPGWLDKALRWRRPRAEALDDVVMLAPSDAFVADLPGGKVPDRDDFLSLPTEDRIARWHEVIERCRGLAEDFAELVEGGRLAEALVPFGPSQVQAPAA